MKIDSIKDPYEAVEDGYITRIHKSIIKKVFGKHSQGGYSTNYYSDQKTRKLFKVAYYSTLDERVASTYYYLDDSLILVKRSRFEKNSDKELSDGRFYFQQGKLIAQTGNEVKAKPIYILSSGRAHLKRWQEDFTDKHK